MRLTSASRLARLVCFVVLGVFAAALGCSAANFYAEVESKHGKKVTKSKIYVRGDRVRQESKAAGRERITIIRGDLKVTWQLYPDKKEYREVKGAKLYAPDPEDLKKFSEVKELGKEMVAGYLCTKTLYIPKEEGGARITIWMSIALKWPLKVEVALPGNSLVSEYKKIKPMTPGKEMFELPPDYKPMEQKAD